MTKAKHTRGKRKPMPLTPLSALPEDSPKSNIGHLDDYGREILDPTPMAPPIGYNPQPSMIENIRNLVKQQLSIQAAEQGFETFEEADDFEIDDMDPTSPYEEIFEPPLPPPAAAQPPPSNPAPAPSSTPPTGDPPAQTTPPPRAP